MLERIFPRTAPAEPPAPADPITNATKARDAAIGKRQTLLNAYNAEIARQRRIVMAADELRRQIDATKGEIPAAQQLMVDGDPDDPDRRLRELRGRIAVLELREQDRRAAAASVQPAIDAHVKPLQAAENVVLRAEHDLRCETERQVATALLATLDEHMAPALKAWTDAVAATTQAHVAAFHQPPAVTPAPVRLARALAGRLAVALNAGTSLSAVRILDGRHENADAELVGGVDVMMRRSHAFEAMESRGENPYASNTTIGGRVV